MCEFLTLISILSGLLGDTAIVFTPDANKKSVVFSHVSPPFKVFQKPPLLDPKKIFSLLLGST